MSDVVFEIVELIYFENVDFDILIVDDMIGVNMVMMFEFNKVVKELNFVGVGFDFGKFVFNGFNDELVFYFVVICDIVGGFEVNGVVVFDSVFGSVYIEM